MTTTTTTTRRRGLSRFALGAGGAALALSAGLTAVPAHAADTGNATLEAIKECESGGDYTAVNASSGASGAYQFLDSTWQSLSAAAGYSSAASAPESVQDAAALELYAQQGSSPWAASEACWSGAAGTTDAAEDTSDDDSAQSAESTASSADAADAASTAGATTTGIAETAVSTQSTVAAAAVDAQPAEQGPAPADIPAQLLGTAPGAAPAAGQAPAEGVPAPDQAPADQAGAAAMASAPAPAPAAAAGAPAGC